MPDDDPPPGGRIPGWISSWASVVAPVSLLSTVLFYFGYVSARSQYEYFGIDVDTIGLGTRDYVMRSPQPLLTPVLVLTVLGAGLFVLHARIRARFRVTAPDRAARVTRRAMLLGLCVLGTGVALLMAYPVVKGWAPYPLVTPLLITAGAGVVAYVSHALRVPRDPGGPDDGMVARRAAGVLVYVLIVAGVFWATATVAQWSGLGVARAQARNLDRLPRVILDTKERLYLRDPVVQETALPAADGQTFRYRYRRLRLLIVGHDRIFLVPERWSASDSTLVIPMDGSVRVQFQFENRAP